jgi:autotransporter-associated beta strand protein
VLSLGTVTVTTNNVSKTMGMAGRLAVGPNGSVAVAIFNPYDKNDSPGGGKMTALQLSQTGLSGSWVAASDVPAVTAGAQAPTSLAIAIDPSSSTTVYVAGDAISKGPFTLNAYRVNFSGDGSTMVPMVDSGTADGSSVHADARFITFQNGRLLLSNDGGIYALTNPSTDTGSWSSLNGNLQLREAYSVAYDAVSHRLLVAAQDNGVALQDVPRSQAATEINGGDGIVAAVNDRTYAADGESIVYHSTQNFGGLTRDVLDSTGKRTDRLTFGTPTSTNPIWNFAPADFGTREGGDPDNPVPAGTSELPFSSQLILNRADPSKIALGTNFVYVTTDDLITGGSKTPLTNVVDVTAQPMGLGSVSAMAYGVYGYNATIDPRGGTALLVGANGRNDDDPDLRVSSGLWFSATAGAGTLRRLSAYGGSAPTSIVFGTQSKFFYVVDGTTLWTSIDGGTTITAAYADVLKNTTNLNVGTPTAVEFINKNGVNALLVGGLNAWNGTVGTGSVNSASPIAVSLVDAAGNLKPGAPFGSGLPNTFANQIVFNPTADVLAVSLYGRGVWTMYDVTSHFSTATTLVFGSADNDSNPGADILTDGEDIDGNTFSRGLRKEGAGTLTVGVPASYSNGTTVLAGTLQITGTGTLGSTVAATTVSGGSTLDLGGTTQIQDGGLTLTGGTVQNGIFQSSGGFTVQNGAVSAVLAGTGGLIKSGTGAVVLSGANTYGGNTSITGGLLTVNGSIASSSGLTVGAAGTVGGSGTLPATIVNGTVAPNNPGGFLIVNTSFTQNPGSTYTAIVSAGGQSDQIKVNGTASLAGTVSVLPRAGSYGNGKKFSLLTATAVNGRYDGATSSYAFLRPALSYDATDVFVTLTPGGFSQAAATPSQAAVAGVLDSNVATASGDFLTVINAFSLMTPAQANASFQAISGQNYAGFSSLGVQTVQLFMNFFALQAGGAQTTGGGGGGSRVAMAEACDVACDATETPRWSAWGGPVGGVGTIAGSATAPGQNFNIGGFAAGIDRRFDGGLLFGVTAGYTAANQYTQTLPGQGSASTVQLGFYGEYGVGNFYLDALAGYAHSSNQMTRPISLLGLAQRTAIGKTTTEQFFGQLEAGYKIALGGPLDPFVTPFARLQGSTATQAGFTESGADSLDLTIAGQTTNSLRTVLGAQAGASFDLGWREKLGLVLRLGWSHEYADTSRPVNASFAGAPASPFTVAGAQAPRDGAIVGLSASTAITEATSLYLRYDGELAGGNTSHIVSAGLRITW